MYDPVVDKDVAMRPFEILYNSQGFDVSSLLQIDTQSDSFSKVPSVGQRRQQPLQRVRPMIGYDANGDFGYVPVCSRLDNDVENDTNY
jgi:hypothetical protein